MTHYPQIAGFKARDTARDAAEQIEPRARYLRDKVLQLLKEQDLTADECAVKLYEDKLSIRPRLTELSKRELIYDTGARRVNDSGKRAIVWRAVKTQGALFAL